jgi:hypothetical protein
MTLTNLRRMLPIHRMPFAAALVGAIALAAAGAAGAAAARTSEAFSFSDPLTGGYDCGAFTVTISGQDKGHVKTWFDRAGDPIMQVGHIQAVETDTNDATGKAIVIVTDLSVHVDFVAGTTALSGVRNLSTKAGAGVVVQHVGHVVVGPDGEPVTLRGKFPEFEAAYMDQDFCAALA